MQRENKISTNKGTTLQSTGEFSSGTMEDRRKWCNIFEVVKEKKNQPGILYT
jgi:hypothetical protein